MPPEDEIIYGAAAPTEKKGWGSIPTLGKVGIIGGGSVAALLLVRAVLKQTAAVKAPPYGQLTYNTVSFTNNVSKY